MEFAQRALRTPFGVVKLVATRRGVAYVGNEGERPERYARWAAARLAHATEVPDVPALEVAAAQLREYFAGIRQAFDAPLDVAGTPFQRRVWDELLRIPYGETRTYHDLAQALHAPAGPRAVGAANGANPLSILVPCHRVLGASGELVGYAGGIRTKAKLLAHEARHAKLASGQTRLVS